jgi:hypothetical protein
MKNLRSHQSTGGVLNYNKLFIIGNGFDLAMGLKSSYNDFMRYYFNQLIANSENSTGSYIPLGIKYKHYEDDLFHAGIGELLDSPKFVFTTLVDNKELSFKEFMDKISKSKSYRLLPKGDFIKDLLNKITKEDWVDVELLYFYHVHKNRGNEDKILQFNEQLAFLKKSLVDYLKSVSSGYEKNDELIGLMNEKMSSELEYDKLKSTNHISKSRANKSYFLNFNYTKILKDTISDKYFNKNEYEINNIHGSIDSEEIDLNKIIFGYGDEDSLEFLDLLKENKEYLLENIKTHKYLESDNYDSLHRFINGTDLYQVIIIGHSCQLSDKVLLNEIFKNENCFSIKLFHYNHITDYTKKTMNISRVVEDSRFVRKTIFSFNESNSIPQSKLLK